MSLKALLKGKTYSSYGVKVQIPPSEGSVRGWLRPYINLPKVVLDLTAWGMKVPLKLDKAVAFRDLWGNGSLILEIPRDIPLIDEVTLSYPALELGLQQDIKVLSAKAIVFADENEEFRMVAPELVLGKVSGIIPDKLTFRMEAWEFKEDSENFQVSGIEFGIESELKEDRREWTVFSLGAGGLFKFRPGSGTVGPWKGNVQGTAKEMPFSELLRRVQELKDLISQEESPGKSKDEKTREEKKEKYRKLAFGIFQKINQIFRELDIKVETQDFLWEGLKVTDKNGGERLLIAPLTLKTQFQERDGNFTIDSKGNLDRIRFLMEDQMPLVMEGLGFKYRAVYRGTNLPGVMEYFLSYYRALLAGSFGKDFEKQVQGMIFSTLAQYPNQTDWEFKVDQIDYQTAMSKAQHRNLNIAFFMHANDAGFQIGEEFNFDFNDESKKDITNGKGELELVVKFPWDGMINISRQAIQDPNFALDFFDIFGKQNVGLIIDFNVDLGDQYFAMDLSSQLDLPLGATIQKAGVPKDWKEGDGMGAWLENLKKIALQNFVKQGYFLFKVQVDRLSKLQAAMDSVKKGASLGLVVLAPFTHVDPKQDTLGLKLEFQGGEVKVNDKPSSALNKIIGPFFKKMGAPLKEPLTPPTEPLSP